MSEEHPATTRFRQYVRIKTVHPDPDYSPSVSFLRQQAEELGLGFEVLEPVPKKPLCLMHWSGTEASLSSLLLTSHMDVVPVFEEHWHHDPFLAFKDEEGNIYGRGTQDMKSVAMQHLEAIRRLKLELGFKPKRTIYVTFTSDEEIGGDDGMGAFVKTQKFKEMNVGFALDEGLASTNDVVPVYYGEKLMWWVRFEIRGQPGHGSQFLSNTVGERTRLIVDRLLDFRAEQQKRLESDPKLDLGDVITVNWTKMSGGVQTNVVPAECSITFDIRVPPTEDLERLEHMLTSLAEEAGDTVLHFDYKGVAKHVTDVDASSSKWFAAFKAAVDKHGLEIETKIMPGGTDSYFLRELCIDGLGFSPMPNHPLLLHDHNEYLNELTFLRGIDIFVDVIANLANV